MLCRKQHTDICLGAPRIIDVENKEQSGARKTLEDEELEALLLEYSYQTLAQLAGSLGVDHTTVSKRLKAIEMIQKQGN